MPSIWRRAIQSKKEMIVDFQTVEEGITKDMETCKMDFVFDYHL